MVFRLKPTYIVESVTDINLEDLMNEGIKGFMFDLDNTIMAPKTGILSERISNWLEEARKDFKIIILSNNPHQVYISQAEELLKCPVYGSAKKPGIKVALKALKDMNLLPSQVAMVGDRPLTDIWVGERLGFLTILVDPIIKKEEIAIVKLLRKLERIFVTPPVKIFTKNSEKK